MDIWSDPEKWKLRAAEQQQTFYTLFGDREWDKLDKRHSTFRDTLQLKISFALFARSYINCTKEQKNVSSLVAEKIQKLSSKKEFLYIGYTYVSTWDKIQDGIVPLIRVKGDNDEVYFVQDYTGSFKCWDDYLENNRLPYVDICYPKNGIYKRRSEERVLVEYGKSKPQANADTKIFKPLEASVFFPFAESSSSKTKFSVRRSMAQITIKKLIHRKSCTDIDSLALWYKILSPDFGTVVESNPDFTSLTMETEHFITGGDSFHTFYDTPYSINGHFAVVQLMKMLTIRSLKKLSKQHLNDFLALLKFIANTFLTHTSQVEKILATLGDDDLRLHNVFNVVSNAPYQQIKDMKFIRNDGEVYHVLDVITKPRSDESPLAKLVKRIVVMLLNIMVVMKKTECHELGPFASNIINPLRGQLYRAMQQETQILQEKLIELLKSRGAEKFQNQIRQCSFDELKIIYDSVQKIATALKPTEIHEIYEREFLKYVFNFRSIVTRGFDEVKVSDVCVFLADKFVSKCRAFFIEHESRSIISSNTDAEGVFYSFIASLKESEVVKDLAEKYKEIGNPAEGRFVATPIVQLKGMCFKIKVIPESSSRPPLFSPPILIQFLAEAAREHFGTDELNKIRKSDRYVENDIYLHKRGSKYLFNFTLGSFNAIQYLFGMEDNSSETIGITITYKNIPFE